MKKRLISSLLALIMVLSLVPFSAFAENENDSGGIETAVESSLKETLGKETDVGNTLYYMEDGKLLSSVDSARPRTIDTDVVWVRERDGLIYYAKIDGNNTDVYKSGDGGFEKYARLFCPIDAFDVEDGFLYYSYNGEMFKLDVETGKEETVMIDKDLTGFCVEENKFIKIHSETNYVEFDEEVSPDDSQIELNAVNNTEFIPKTVIENGKSNLVFSPELARIARKMSSDAYKDVANAMGKEDFKNIKHIKGSVKSVADLLIPLNLQVGVKNFTVDGKEKHVLAIAFKGTTDAVDVIADIVCVDNNGYHAGFYATAVKVFNALYYTEFPSLKMTFGDYLGHCKDGQEDYYILVTGHSLGGAVANVFAGGILAGKGIKSNAMCYTFASPTVCSSKKAKSFKANNIFNIINTEDVVPDVGYNIAKGARFGVDLKGTVSAVPYTIKNNHNIGETYEKVTTKVINKIDSLYKYTLSYFNNWYSSTIPALGNAGINFNSIKAPSGTIQKASYSLGGTITSNCNISYISGEVINTATNKAEISHTVNPYQMKYSISGSALDRNLKFQTLTSGCTYILRYTVKDATGNVKSWTSGNFTVGNSSSGGGYSYSAPAAPNVWVESIEYGQMVCISTSDSSATLHMWATNGDEHYGNGTITWNFTTPGTYSVDGWATKNNRASYKVAKSFAVNKQPTPNISDAQFNTNDATVTISGDGEIYYTLDGSTPSKGSNRYTGPIHITNSCTVKAISAKWGCVNSDVAEKWQNISPPDTPSITLNTKDKLAQGKTTSVSWQPTARATSYTAVMYRGGTEVNRVTTSGTSASFLLGDRSDTENFEYRITVYASNFKGNSADSNQATVWGMHPVKVTFVDRIVRSGELTEDRLREVKRKLDNREGEGTSEKLENQVISIQKVDYDEYPSKPSTPSKKGFTFAGWTAGLYEPATTDKTVYGEFDINYYNVAFYDVDDNNKRMDQALSSQKYMYTSEAILPDNYDVPVAYIFQGWNIDNEKSTCFDLTFIDGNVIADAVYGWANDRLKAYIRIDSLVRKDESYTVNVSIKNNQETTSQGRVLVSLYTSNGRNVYTQICEQDVNLGTLREWTAQPAITLLYNGRITYAVAYILESRDDRTGGMLSEASEPFYDITYDKTSNYYKNNGYWGEWSAWQDSPITANEFLQVDTPRTVYRYRDKQFTTTNNTRSLSGWNYWYSDSHVQGEVYNGTNWVGAEDNDYRRRTVRTNWVGPAYKTQYHYFRYYNGYNAPYTHYSSSHPYFEEYWVDYTLPWLRYSGGMDQYGDGYTGYSGNKHWLICDGSTYGGPGPWTRSVLVRDGYTEYWYQDTYYTHHFWNWGGWSGWSTTKPSSNGNRDIQSKTQYRSRDWIFEYDMTKEKEAEDGTKYEKFKDIPGYLPDMGTEYVTEEVYNQGKHTYVSGPYYIKNADAEDEEDKYILVDNSNHEVTEYRYGRYTNGSYTMPCLDCAEELYGGEWQLEWTDWSETPCDEVVENSYECAYNEEHNHDKAKYEDGTDYWNEYIIGDQSYCFAEERIVNKEITYSDPIKYYKVKTSLENEKATVLIYKKTNSDPTQAQLQYIKQIDIGSQNSYQFTANTKELISYDDTGDFIVALALEGGMRLINIDVIKAIAPEYTVKFYVNGDEYRTESVKQGEAVDLNNFSIDDIEAMNPGYRFVKWDKSVVDVTEDMQVNAVMVPKTYSVVFVDYENQTTELQELAFGETIPAPEVEPVEGKIFLGWDNGMDTYTAISESMIIDDSVDRYYLLDDGETYIKKADYDRRIHTLKDETEYLKAKTSTVTGNMIVTARWETITYNVKFVDLEGNTVSEQTIEHGKSAELPEFITVDDKTYTWDLTGGQWWNVTADMIIHPFDPTPSTVAPPVLDASLADVGGSFYASLSAADDESKIYYTYHNEITETDAKAFVETKVIADVEQEEDNIALFGIKLFGEDVHEEHPETEYTDDESTIVDYIQEYTEPIEITEGTVIYAFTVDKDGNISPIAVFEYGYDYSEDEGIIENTYEIDPDCPQITLPSLTVKPGETVEVPVSIKNNPGLTNLSLVFGYDSSNLTLVSATNGDVFANTEYSGDTREDGNCKFTWLSKSLNENDGTLLTLTFKAGDNAGKEKITMTIEEAVAPNEEESPFATQDGTVQNVGNNAYYGDINGDGEADFADAVMLIRYDIGLLTLTDTQKKFGDVNGDGDVDFADAIKIMRFDAGFISNLR